MVMNRLLSGLLLFLSLSILILFVGSVVHADIETEYNTLTDILQRSYKVNPEMINVIPSSVNGLEQYIVYTDWKGNSSLTTVITDPFIKSYIEGYGVSSNMNINLTNNYLIPNQISGLLYKVDGLPTVSVYYNILEYDFINTETGLEIPNPVISLYHEFPDKYDFLTAVLYITPLLSSNNTFDSVSIKIEWFSGSYNKTNGEVETRDLNSAYISINWTTFKTNGLKIYLMPNFYSYVEPSDQSRYMVFGFSYLIKIPNTLTNTTGSFAWETVKLYNADETDYSRFIDVVNSVYEWNVWIGEGVFYYSDKPILHILPSYGIVETSIKAVLKTPVVYSVFVNPYKLFGKFHTNELDYYQAPPEFTDLFNTNTRNNTMSVDIVFIVFIFLGIAIVLSLFLPYSDIIGITVLAILIYAFNHDPRIAIISVISLGLAVLNRWGVMI